MKNLLGVLFIFILSGCAELKTINPVENLSIIDFTPYTQKGFLITPEKYSGNYESIGIIDYSFKPGATLKSKVMKSIKSASGPYYKDNAYVENFEHEWVVDSISFDAVLQKVYEICIRMGADALINFHPELISEQRISSLPTIEIYGIKITGFAIKRKDK
jgi:hypothetical protein